MLVDSAGDSVGLTVYNLADSAHFNTGDIIAIPDPHMKEIHLETHKVYKLHISQFFNKTFLEVFTSCFCRLIFAV